MLDEATCEVLLSFQLLPNPERAANVPGTAKQELVATVKMRVARVGAESIEKNVTKIFS